VVKPSGQLVVKPGGQLVVKPRGQLVVKPGGLLVVKPSRGRVVDSVIEGPSDALADQAMVRGQVDLIK
jgi:hypothetical protein